MMGARIARPHFHAVQPVGHGICSCSWAGECRLVQKLGKTVSIGTPIS
jgi:hypothetical protein